MSTIGAGRSQRKVNYGMLGVFTAITVIISACGGQAAISPAPTPYISAHPLSPDYRALSAQLTFPLRYDPNEMNYFQVDLRSADLTNQDLSGSIDALRHVNYDSKTKWPAANLLPAGFTPKKMMDIGKNPGLGIRKLHKQGITGKGIGIAVIDQGLLVDHIEYKDQLRYYEEIEGVQGFPASMHGPAVASLAVGKTAGVAPGADLYFISASPCMDKKAGEQQATYTVACDADALRQIIAINQKLPDDRKIRVVIIAMGWNEKSARARADGQRF
jgi:subtilisin family serine protease